MNPNCAESGPSEPTFSPVRFGFEWRYRRWVLIQTMSDTIACEGRIPGGIKSVVLIAFGMRSLGVVAGERVT
jgi:hypothetical protein